MGTECQKPYTDEDKQLLDEAEERARQEEANDLGWEEYAKEAPAIEAAIAQHEATINEKIDSVARYIDADMQPVRSEDIMLIHDSPSGVCAEPNSAQKETFMERILSADPQAVIVPFGREREIPPFFIQDFKGIQEFQLEIEGKVTPILIEVHTPILPTIENLERMLAGKNPLTPWEREIKPGEKEKKEEIEFHHRQQKAEGPLMVLWQGYHKEMPAEKGEKAMSKDDRSHYENIQRPNICKAIAELYLGNWTQAFEQAKK